MTTEDYRIERMDFSNPPDMQRLVDLQNAVYKGVHNFSSNTFKFWYLDNPNGNVISFNALVGDIIAAHYAIIPMKMLINGRIVNGALSMATVTHPNHRGRGLFKRLAQMAYSCAKEEGLEFVVGVANANSFPGFIKHLGFYEVGQLDVLFGIKDNIRPSSRKLFNVYWDNETIKWRIGRLKDYYRRDNRIFGCYPMWKFIRCPFLHTFMGIIPVEYNASLNISYSRKWIRPVNLYVGMGSNAKDIGYRSVPSFIKHSPFHLIFKDLTEGGLPVMTKENVFFQLMDFDVV